MPETEAAEASPSLEWEAYYDDYDNTYWRADSVARDDGGPFKWQVYPTVRRDRLVYMIDTSAEELIGEPRDYDDLEFFDVDAAKAWCQIRENEVRAEPDDETEDDEAGQVVDL